jgi:exodeoxyribonuclease V gamma subunit
MAGLNVFTSNRLEILAEALAEVLRNPLASPLDQEIIVVQSKGMERWVCLQLADQHGVCANYRFPFPNAFMGELFRSVLRKVPETSLFDPDVMTWRIMKALPLLIEEPAFKKIRNYLEGGRTDIKRFQLSQRIADLFDQYLVFRPEMVFQWEKGKAHHWQSLLWRALSEGHESDHRAALAGEFFNATERHTASPPELPERLSVFGISALPRFHMRFFASLARFAQVNLFLMNPCREYWGEILSASEIKKKTLSGKRPSQDQLHMEKGNSLLASMGGLGRDFFDTIQEFQAREFSLYKEPEDATLLNAVQTDILRLHERKEKTRIGAEDLSVQIHSCHSPMRELEVLRDQLLRMFEDDLCLLPKDILVMMPDIETYAPYIQAVFDTVKEDNLRIPFSMADRSIRKEGGIGETFLRVLDLEGSRFGVTGILNILESEAVRRKFGFSDEGLELVRRWVSDTRICWGIDERHKMELGLPTFPQNTWRAGLERLLLGFAMPGREEHMFSETLPYDPIEGGEAQVLGSLTDFAEKLFIRARSLGRLRTLEGWQRELVGLLEDFFDSGEDTEREIQLIRRILGDLVTSGGLSLFEEPVHLRVVRSYLEQRLNQTGFGYGFMTGGVTFCAMLPMRSIPFKVICLLGMDSGAYPRQSNPLGFDYMARHPRRGDRSRRKDDRYLFLEAILSARRKLYISYVGQSIQDNSTIPPSMLVSELMDYIEQGFDVPDRDIREHLHTRHRLHAFSPEYFKDHHKLFTYSVGNHEIAGIMPAAPKEPEPFVTTGLSEPDATWRKVDLQGLCAFFSNPARFLLNRRLGLYLQEGSAMAEEREPFEVEALERYLLEESMLHRRLQGRDLKEHFRFVRASGRLPHGTVGECLYARFSPGVERFSKELREWLGDHALEAVDFELDLGAFSLRGTLDQIHQDRMVRFRYSRVKGRDLLTAWIHHLVLNALRPEGCPRQTLLAGLSPKGVNERETLYYEYGPLEEGHAILEGLMKRYWEGMKNLLHFFPESSRQYAQLRLGKGKPREAALEQARKTWEGGEFVRGEVKDAYYQLCFRREPPLDETFEEIAVEVFEPMLKVLSEKDQRE